MARPLESDCRYFGVATVVLLPAAQSRLRSRERFATARRLARRLDVAGDADRLEGHARPQQQPHGTSAVLVYGLGLRRQLWVGARAMAVVQPQRLSDPSALLH